MISAMKELTAYLLAKEIVSKLSLNITLNQFFEMIRLLQVGVPNEED